MQELERKVLKAKLKQYHRHLEGKVGSFSEFQISFQICSERVLNVTILQVDIQDNSDDETVQCKEAWSSRLHRPKVSEQNASGPMSIQTFKRTANNFLHKGNFEQAIQYYTAAIDASAQEGLEDSQVAVLHSNRALAHTRNGSYTQASPRTGFPTCRCLSPCNPPSHRTTCFHSQTGGGGCTESQTAGPSMAKTTAQAGTGTCWPGSMGRSSRSLQRGYFWCLIIGL